jgi:PAS domain S-box-containing protein
VAKAANAPVYGCLETYFGHGIVGGRLTSLEMSGVKVGEMGLRILRGEMPSDIPMSGQGTIINLFDWRQFKRWGVHEDLLPPDSTVRFKTPSFWELYRWYIILAILLILVESGLISFLLRQRVQHRRAQTDLAERLGFEEMLSGLSARFVSLAPDRVDSQIAHELKMLGEFLKVDRVTMFEASEINQRLHAVQSYTRSGVPPAPSQIEFDQLSWTRHMLLNGEPVIYSDPDDLPAEAGAEKDFFHAHGIQSTAVIPFKIGRETLGLLAFTMLQSRREWPDGLIRQCSLIAEVFANALARRQHVKILVQAETKYRTVADFTYDWEYWANVDGTMEYTSPSCERISGYTTRDFKDDPSLFRNIIVPEDRDIWDSHYHDSRQELKPRKIQFRIQAREGQIRWIEHSCQPVIDDQGGLRGFRASNRDVTKRKQAEIDLREAYSEIEQLKNQLEAETAYLQEEIKLEHNFESIIGNSAAIQYALYKVEQVAATDTTVLVLGETGTGKELISRAIHNNSLRKGRPMVKVNCATLPSHLIESELFGHERGAFTGAQTRQMGRFEVADGTSIFLDEIGELPLELQTKLLRVIQDGEFERLGSTRTIKVDVRMIAATNRDMETEVSKGHFREDLFYRLNVFPITVPSLRDRIEDIPLLTQFFLEKVSKRLGKSIELIPERVMQKLQDYPWPGNVRELENVIERAVINSSGPKLCLADNLAGPAKREMSTPLKSLQEIETDHIIRVLEETTWRIDGAKGAALILDMNPSTLRSRLRKLGIQKP